MEFERDERLIDLDGRSTDTVRALGGRSCETKDAIVAAALAIMEEVGSEALRVSEVAKRASVGTPTVYYYFDGRSRLIAEARAQRLGATLAKTATVVSLMENALADEDREGFLGALHRYVAHSFRPEYLEDCWESVETLVMVKKDPSVRSLAVDMILRHFESVTSMLERAEEMGWIKPSVSPVTLLYFINCAILGQIYGSFFSEVELDRIDVAKLVDFVFLDGFGLEGIPVQPVLPAA